MDLTPYVEHLRSELTVAADVGGDEARALAVRLTAPLESAARLTLLDALSAASAEITRELAPGAVDMRLRGRDPEFVVTAPQPPGTETVPLLASPVAPLVPLSGDGDDSGTARINFRLPTHLKARVDDAADQEGLSTNAWLVRAVARALEPGDGTPRPAGPATREGLSIRGWAR
ncbi:hypothetical protein [Streptomyces venezuelae]|uniref:hypothetical protein n=1 Tax=Streptomyces venezuelae TaxID=54571 RepID=UPI00278C89DD|nr:hypothetical protein [Streptomyces venezuelae]